MSPRESLPGALPQRRWRPSSRARGVDRAWIPALITLAITVFAALLAVPVLPLVGALGLVVVTPIARTFASRVRVWALTSLAATGLISVIPGIPVTRTTALVVLVVAVLVGMAATWRRGPCSWRPRLRLADWLAVGCALAVMGMLALPYLGAGPAGIVLDLARAYDTLSHYTMVSNLVTEGSVAWTTSDGSAAEWANYYPLGLHVLGALAVLLLGTNPSDLVTAFALTSVLAAALSALLLTLLAIDVAEATGDDPGRRRRGLLAGAVAVMALPLGGLLAGMFELGHVAFLYPATIIASASWMALATAGRGLEGALALMLAAAGVAWTYPPLLGGLLTPAAVLAARTTDHRTRVPMLAVGALLLAVAAGQVWRWRWRLDFVAEATGEFSTPVATSLMMTFTTVILVALAQRHDVHLPAVRALAPVIGFWLAAGAIAILALAVGFPPQGNYYVAKLLQAGWVAQLPLIIGVSSWALARIASRHPRHCLALQVVGVLGLALFLALIPDGRHRGLSGVSLLDQRILERDRALGTVTVVEAGRELGPTDRDAAVMVSPPGWFYRVSQEDPQLTGWVKDGSSASHWLNSLRGVKSAQQSAAAACMGGAADARSNPCLAEWLERHPDATLRIVLPTDRDRRSFEGLVSGFPGRVVLHQVAKGSSPNAE